MPRRLLNRCRFLPRILLSAAAAMVVSTAVWAQTPANSAVVIEFTNLDPLPHNFALYPTSAAQDPIFQGEIFSGPATRIYQFRAPAQPGNYYFQCDVHPAQMNGTFVVTAP